MLDPESTHGNGGLGSIPPQAPHPHPSSRVFLARSVYPFASTEVNLPLALGWFPLSFVLVIPCPSSSVRRMSKSGDIPTLMPRFMSSCGLSPPGPLDALVPHACSGSLTPDFVSPLMRLLV